MWQLVAEKRKDYERLANAQYEEYSQTHSAASLLDCCRAYRHLQQWNFIADRAEELVREISTQGALELAADGLLHSQRPSECLELLETHRGLCRGGDWSPFLRQLAAECYRLLTNFPAAISELERAVATGGGVPVLMKLFQTQLEKGDLPASLQTARLLSRSRPLLLYSTSVIR